MKSITDFALNNSRTVVMVMLVIFFGGIILFGRIPKLEDPRITIREAVVQAQNPGMSVEKIERLLTRPIEEQIRTMGEVDDIKDSTSRVGECLIHVTIKDEVPAENLPMVWKLLRNRMSDLEPSLPAGTTGPMVNDTFGDTSMATIALWSDGFSMAEMREKARDIRERINLLKGIQKIDLTGVQEERIYIEYSNAKLAQLGIHPSVIGNTLRNFNDRAVLIEGAFPTEGPPPTPFVPALFPVVTGNVISGGAAGQPFASADGISLLVVVGAVVSDNTVTGFRNGLDAQYVSRVNVNGNEFAENGVGIEFYLAGSESPDDANVIESNLITRNATYGLSATGLFVSQVTDNEVSKNGSHPEFDGGIRFHNSSGNFIGMNQVHQNSGFGIVIDGHFIDEDFPVEDAFYNTVAHNDVNRNGGVGIVIFNNAHDNQIVYNESYRNSVGVVAGFESPFPYGNLYQGNTFEKNKDVDVLDQDPDCNDDWMGNTFGTVDSASEDCVE